MPHPRYYSPAIKRSLVSVLYYEARHRKVPMTRLTNDILTQALADSVGWQLAKEPLDSQPSALATRLKGPYDIALNRQPDSSFGLTADLWNGHVEAEVGPNYGKLMQLYAVHKATREARNKGHLVKRAQEQDGSIKLTIGA